MLLLLLTAALLALGSRPALAAQDAPRVVITTDGEGDDIASMHRFLLYANEFEVEGIVSSASQWHWAGDPDATPPIPANSWHGTDWIPELIDRGYREAHPRLLQHDRHYPRPEALLRVIKQGNIARGAEMARNTEGSEWIKEILLDREPGPVYLQAWGGTNTIAAALRSIRDEYAGTPQWDEIYREVSDKAVVYIIQDQDSTYRNYLAKAWPDVRTIINRDQFEAFAYSWPGYNAPAGRRLLQKDWVSANLLRGPLMSDYPVIGNGFTSLCRPAAMCQDGDWFSEGDTPAFLHTIPTGLRQLEDPANGGWGGRFLKVGDRLWIDDPRYFGIDRYRAVDRTPEPIETATLAAAAKAGDTDAKFTWVDVAGHTGSIPFRAGDRVTVGTGAAAETRTMVRTGTGSSAPMRLPEPAAAGSTNVPYIASGRSAVELGKGAPLTIGTGENRETVTITDVGSPRLETTAAAPAAAGDTVLRVARTGNFCIEFANCLTPATVRSGDVLTIGTGADQFTATVASVGTPFASGSGLTLTAPLPAAVAGGTAVLSRGTGLTVTPALTAAHAANETMTSPGSGLELDEPLRGVHAIGAPVTSDHSPHWPQSRWTEAIQNDLAARTAWTVDPLEATNHAPRVDGPLNVEAAPGQTVRLAGTATDPDGDDLVARWWQYREAGTYDGDVTVAGASSLDASYVVPENAKPGDTIHTILEVRDDRAPYMTGYHRVITTVGEKPAGGGPTPPPVPNPQPPVPGPGPKPVTPAKPSYGRTVAALRAQRNAAAATLRRLGLGRLLGRGARRTVTVDQAGTYTEQVLLRVRRNGKPVRTVVVARGTRRFAAAGRATITLKPTAAGRRALRGQRRATLTVRVTFRRASGGKALVTSRTVRVSRR
ncbi:DUF1593 domain-containing protein [Patulibacter americanus]|uniref:DUF1593 domain-containing protein n=1 Tax=Patulibacter americanus TaxID=588672 RepID=UPI00146E77DE|nr:nucleoside hydrolase-like domain-containing protein [Patulibacter americanus]